MKLGKYLTNIPVSKWNLDTLERVRLLSEVHDKATDENGYFVVPLSDQTTEYTLEKLKSMGFFIIDVDGK
jgi:hypothetical protein